ncbi:MAG: hypothetical protein HN353_07250 [Bdellovibrionales bacterium]|jgi:hypothetical protein|nr:hypothetical protein [Bdellovibrionales bacterium]MBT3526606.1 hypothetical protein [Bdellovibrionales bacterium]MBT7668043.1 hypothetical protein [Bdellovibrionales bacterium]MBT7766736.1 hypothetical protein [Bdellovibrionales bacterium]
MRTLLITFLLSFSLNSYAFDIIKMECDIEINVINSFFNDTTISDSYREVFGGHNSVSFEAQTDVGYLGFIQNRRQMHDLAILTTYNFMTDTIEFAGVSAIGKVQGTLKNCVR